MKIKKLSQKLKSSIRKHFVRKKDYDALAKEVHRLAKKLAKLEKCCESSAEVKKKPQKKTAPAAPASTPVVSRDELTRIQGIGPVLEKKLHGLGIFTFSQIAKWNDADIEEIAKHLNFKGRIEREEWIKQAKGLAG